MWGPSEIATLVAAVGGSVLIPRMLDGLKGAFTGSHTRERTRVQDLIVDRREAERERDAAYRSRDRADRKRRLWAEHASHLRRMLLDLGVDPGELPDPPKPYSEIETEDHDE